MLLRRRLRGSYQKTGAHVVAAVLAAAVLAAAVLAAAVLGAAALAALWAGPAASASTHPRQRASATASHRATTASHRGWVKYYIVPPPKNGFQEFLYQIALETLGNGNLYPEIFQLNKGRPQPGGGALEDPTSILPGWILVLPASASGPGVRYGPLPAVTPPPDPSFTASGTSSPSAAASPSRVRAAGTVAAPSSPVGGYADIVGVLLLALPVTIASLLIARRRRRKTVGGLRPGGARTPVQPAPSPPARAGLGSPALDPAAAPGYPPASGPPPALDAQASPSYPASLDSLPDLSQPAGHDAGGGPGAAAVKTAGLEMASRAVSGAQNADPVNGRPQLTEAETVAAVSATTPFSPVALRILGAQRSSAQLAGKTVTTQEHEVALGDDRIQVVLAEAPAVIHDGRPQSGRSWLAATPYLVWAPLPYDIPDDGIAFACVGAGDDGCLFIDLAAAPGAVAIGGDGDAPARLAESIAHQLCTGAAAGRPCSVVVIGEALPEPYPVGAAWLARLQDLESVPPPASDGGTEIVICELRSNEDAFALARYVSSSDHRVIPVVLADLPDAPWSLTARPSRRLSEAPQPKLSLRDSPAAAGQVAVAASRNGRPRASRPIGGAPPVLRAGR
jgi:hypothetical protein